MVNHEFTHHIPPGDQMEEGMVYVSIPYATAVHLCCCGCGNEVVTPIHPDQWQLTFDGESISLSPSIGNWGFYCQSHYWITRDRVIWEPKWRDRKSTKAGQAKTFLSRIFGKWLKL